MSAAVLRLVELAPCVICGEYSRLPWRSGRYAPASRHRCPSCVSVHRSALLADISPITRYADDVAAQLWVSAYPGGMGRDEVARLFSVSATRIGQIEAAALAKLRAELEE